MKYFLNHIILKDEFKTQESMSVNIYLIFRSRLALLMPVRNV